MRADASRLGFLRRPISFSENDVATLLQSCEKETAIFVRRIQTDARGSNPGVGRVFRVRRCCGREIRRGTM